MVSDDPRHNRLGKLDLCLVRQLALYVKLESPPTQVCTLPINIIQYLDTTSQGTTPRQISISNLTWIEFFFLLCLGEYFCRGTDTSHHPFRLKDFQFFMVPHPYNTLAPPRYRILIICVERSIFRTAEKHGILVLDLKHSNYLSHTRGMLV